MPDSGANAAAKIVINECRIVLRANRGIQFIYLDGLGRSVDGVPLPAAAEDPEHDL
jgi:hypothetical protein